MPNASSGLLHQPVHLLHVERRRFQHVVRRPRLIRQPQLLGLAAKGRARQDRQIEHLHFANRLACDAGSRCRGGTESTVSPGRPRIRSTWTLIPSASRASTPRSKAARFVGPAHQLPRPRLDRLQPDLDLVEVGLRGAAGPSAASIPSARNSPENARRRSGVAACQQPQELGEIGPLVERRVEQHDFLRPVLDRVAQIGKDLFGREKPRRRRGPWDSSSICSGSGSRGPSPAASVRRRPRRECLRRRATRSASRFSRTARAGGGRRSARCHRPEIGAADCSPAGDQPAISANVASPSPRRRESILASGASSSAKAASPSPSTA